MARFKIEVIDNNQPFVYYRNSLNKESLSEGLPQIGVWTGNFYGSNPYTVTHESSGAYYQLGNFYFLLGRNRQAYIECSLQEFEKYILEFEAGKSFLEIYNQC